MMMMTAVVSRHPTIAKSKIRLSHQSQLVLLMEIGILIMRVMAMLMIITFITTLINGMRVTDGLYLHNYPTILPDDDDGNATVDDTMAEQ
mmetsp:Transcript_31596/g.35269  ORF Transcript_31596/g.35269 Transcript_31596/m.35269 type:complete len:90 (+) Transcript_31596:155-424(+)